jgi:hypothetical protein
MFGAVIHTIFRWEIGMTISGLLVTLQEGFSSEITFYYLDNHKLSYYIQ